MSSGCNLGNVIRTGNFYCFQKKEKKYAVVCTAGIVGAVVLSVSAANYLWVNLDIGTYLETQGKDSTFIQDHYVDVKNTELIFPEQKRNSDLYFPGIYRGDLYGEKKMEEPLIKM